MIVFFEYLYLQYCIFKEDKKESAFASSLLKFFTMEVSLDEENKDKEGFLLSRKKEIEIFNQEKRN